jgi:hypothetical protein
MTNPKEGPGPPGQEAKNSKGKTTIPSIPYSFQLEIGFSTSPSLFKESQST